MNHSDAKPNQPLHNAQNSAVTNLSAADLAALAKEDAEDLQAFDDRADEPVMTYAALLEDLRLHGKVQALP